MTADLDRMIKFYADAFGGEVTFEITKTDDHPRMANIELGGGAGLKEVQLAEGKGGAGDAGVFGPGAGLIGDGT